MKIGFDARRYFLNRTGLGDYSRNLVHHLHDNFPDPEIHLFTSDTGQHYPIPDYANLHVKEKSLSTYWRNFGIPRALKSNHIDVYHGLSNELPLGIKKSGVAALVTIHDLLFIRYPGHYAHFDRKIYSLKTRKACSLSEHIIAISEATKSDLVNLFNISESKISVIPPIATFLPKKIELSGSIPRNQDKPVPYILCVSSFQKRKNLELLIEAYNESHAPFRLIIAGRKGETSRSCAILALQKKSGFKAELRFDVSHQQLADLFEKAHAFIYPSVYEGFGMPVLDALQHGLPVLTGRQTSMEEIAGDAGIYFDPTHKGSIIEAIHTLEKIDISDYRNRANLRLASFSASFLSEKLMNIYRNFVK